jgi:hypothetical protein
MATTYTVIIQETDKDLVWLNTEKYDLAVAKAVQTGGKIVANTIYDSAYLAPTMSISWKEVYGLNFSTSVPAAGAEVTYTGKWTPCAIGGGYKLSAVGTWVPNNDDPNNEADSLNVLNEYHGVSIIVGVQDQTTKKWRPIFFSDSKLVVEGYGSYKPLEVVQIWYANEQKSGYVVASQRSHVEEYDMSDTAAEGHKHWFLFNTSSGKWTDQTTPFVNISLGRNVEAKSLDYPEEDVFGIVRIIQFTRAVINSARFIQHFKIEMERKGWKTNITVETENRVYKVTSEPKDEYDGPGNNPDPAIDESLKACKTDGDLPPGENWSITE